jgi:hypothetical protein
VLGANHPGGVLNPAYGPNTLGDPRLTASYGLDFGSAALGTASHGVNYGASIAEWTYLINVPDKISVDKNPGFTVGGPGIVAFKWRVDGGLWSASQVIGTGGVFPRTGATVRQARFTLSNLSDGPHLLEVLSQDMAGNWQDADPAVESGPQAAPSRYEWTVSSAPQFRLNEVLAAGAGTDPDFIELANFGGSGSMAGWRITDSPRRAGYTIPAGTTLANETVLVLPFSTTGIGLDQDGDEVFLYDASGVLVDQLTFGPQAQGYSLGRNEQGSGWILCRPTPGTGNTAGGIVQLGDPSAIRLSEWFADSRILFTSDWVELTNPTSLPVALSGLFLSDDAATGAQRKALPANSYIAPTGFTVFTLDGSNGGHHLAFSLDAEQEALALDFGNTRIDTALFGPGLRDQSQSRTATGSPVWTFLPTRGFTLPPSDASYQNAVNILRFLRITEIMYNPAGGNDYEYLELTNTGTGPLELQGVRFVEGIDFTFTGPFTLEPGAQTVLVVKESAFRMRYGPQVPIAGSYLGRLDNNGETLALALPAPFDGNVLRFRYESFWQFQTTGQGRSLQIISPTTAPSGYDERSAWQASRLDYGTPAGFNAPPPPDYPGWTSFYAIPGGVGTDEDGDGLISLLEFALGSDPLKNQPGDGADRAPGPGNSGDALSLTVNLPVSALGGGYGSQGIAYTLQDSTDFVTWRSLAVKTPAAVAWTNLTTFPVEVQTGVPTGNFMKVTLKPQFPRRTQERHYLRLNAALSP